MRSSYLRGSWARIRTPETARAQETSAAVRPQLPVHHRRARSSHRCEPAGKPTGDAFFSSAASVRGTLAASVTRSLQEMGASRDVRTTVAVSVSGRLTGPSWDAGLRTALNLLRSFYTHGGPVDALCHWMSSNQFVRNLKRLAAQPFQSWTGTPVVRLKPAFEQFRGRVSPLCSFAACSSGAALDVFFVFW